MSEAAYKSMKDLPATTTLAPGTPMCAGCGGLEAIKQVCAILGENTVFVNAASCMTLLSTYPFTPFDGSWFYTSMASAPAGAQGIRDALDILLTRQRISHEEDLKVVVLTGDGAAAGIGMASTSGALERGLDFYYLCYDNEGYGNTGHQTSALSPHGAHTATDRGPEGVTGEKKDLFSIWAAHGPAYLATLAVSEPVDLARKVQAATTLSGPKMFIALSPCPTGWHYEPKETVRIDRLAVKTGMWPLKEFRGGKVTHTKPPRPHGQRPPVEDYLKIQGRFAHLFKPERNQAVLDEIQHTADAYWEGIV